MTMQTQPDRPAAFADIDPITVEVIGSAFMSIVEEMGEALVRASYSTNIKERRDCSTALFDAQGRTLCQAEHIPMHLGSFLDFVHNVTRRYPRETIRPGDTFIGNDAYEGGGTHLPDIVMGTPVFVGGELVAWALNTGHHADFADRGHAHIYQEGIRIPAVRLYRDGQLQADVMDLILLNCQVPAERRSDLQAQQAANIVGARRLTALCEKYGTDVVMRAGDALQDYAERKMRAAIAAMPDGTWSYAEKMETLELDEVVELGVTVTIRGDEMHLDFRSPPQVRASLNMTRTALLAAVYFTVKAVADPTVLPNEGLGRPLKVTAPRGSIVQCEHPAAVNGRFTTCQRIVDIIMGALAQAVPRQAIAGSNSAGLYALFSGSRPDGAFWAYLESMGGGGGARHDKDGLHGVQVHLTNTSNLPVEALELEYPLTVERYELIDGSGGRGRFCGGMGLRRVYRAGLPTRVELDSSRAEFAAQGLAGGGPGGCFTYRVNGQPGALKGGIGVLQAGDLLEIASPGGGGYGPFAERSPEARARDLRERRYPG